jgi:dTDP-glucose 4,6-dehydratase
MKKKILCTGSAGFIMSNYIRQSLYKKQPYVFTGIDTCNDTIKLNNVFSNKDHVFYIGDICVQSFLDVIFEIQKPNIVIHAAELSTSHNIINDNELLQTNVLGTKTVLNSCAKYNIEKFLYLSTYQVNTSPSLYAASKLSGEVITKSMCDYYNIPFNILRLPNVYGPRQSKNKLIPSTINKLINNEKVLLQGDGSKVRDWLHVNDICSAINTVLENGDKDIYEASYKQEFSNLEVVYEICKILKKDGVDFYDDKSNEVDRYISDPTDLLNIGWVPENKFKSTLPSTIEWYNSNKWFFK